MYVLHGAFSFFSDLDATTVSRFRLVVTKHPDVSQQAGAKC